MTLPKQVHRYQELSSVLNTTRAFLITRYGISTTRVIDITGQITASYDTKEFKDQLKTVTSAAYSEFYLTATWLGTRKIEVIQGIKIIAEWKMPALPSSLTRIDFPLGCSRGLSQLKLEPTRLLDFDQRFIVNSIPYTWNRTLTLYTHYLGSKVQVGKYLRYMRCIKSNGVLLDTEEGDEVVGVLTCLMMLR